MFLPPLGGTRGDGCGEEGTADPGESMEEGVGVHSATEVKRVE